ncbi:MAG: hypothetical protein AAFX78_10070 [Cyanobacteria bacterium J06638_20]
MKHNWQTIWHTPALPKAYAWVRSPLTEQERAELALYENALSRGVPNCIAAALVFDGRDRRIVRTNDGWVAEVWIDYGD